MHAAVPEQAALEAANSHLSEKRIDSSLAQPAGQEPERQRNQARRSQQSKSQALSVHRATALDEPGEHSAQAVDACRHHAHDFQSPCRSVQLCEFDRESRLSARQKDSRRVDCIGKPPQLLLAFTLHLESQSSVRPRSRHHGKVPHLFPNFQPPDRNRHPLSADLLLHGLLRIEWDAQIPRQRIRAPQRNDAQCCARISVQRHEPLQHLVHGSVAAAGKHHVCSIAHCRSHLLAGRSRRVRRYRNGLMAE